MRNPFGSRTIAAGTAGILLGALSEVLINRVAGTTVVTDGLMWGAALAILLVSLPNFTHMGSLTTKSDKPVINFVVGVGVFLLISLAVVVLFYGIFSVIARLFLGHPPSAPLAQRPGSSTCCEVG